MEDDSARKYVEDADFADTPAGWQAHWAAELAGGEKTLRGWRTAAHRVVRRYLDKRDDRQPGRKRLNMYAVTVDLMESVLYDKKPLTTVERRFNDADDAPARLAAQILERITNQDVERSSDPTDAAFANGVQDRLMPGLGIVRLRYVVRLEKVPAQEPMLGPDGREMAPAVPESERKVFEDAVVEYHNWADAVWSPCRTFDELRWFAFKNPMSKRQVEERFGKDAAEALDYAQKVSGSQGSENHGVDQEVKRADPLARATVYEIWSKEHGKVFWWAKGMDVVLDEQEDPLGLEGFWPFAQPLIAHPTTSAWIPTPDYAFAQDQYEEVDELTTRIGLLEDALKVTGLYDKSQPEIGRLLGEAQNNQMIPVDNWALLAEKGGVKGCVDWFPLDMVVQAIDKLSEKREQALNMLFQVTGYGDIMRGQSSVAGRTATESRVVARASGVRMQRLQERIARWVSDTMALRCEIVCGHFSDETIIARSNILETPDGKDPKTLQAALRLLRDRFASYRIAVRPEQLAQTDFDAVKTERTEFIEAVAQFLSAATPLMQSAPAAAPLLLELLKWYVAGFRSAANLEAILDRAVAAAQQKAQEAAQNPQPLSPSPEQLKIQLEHLKFRLEEQRETQRAQLEERQQHLEAERQAQQQHEEAAARGQERSADLAADLQTMQVKHTLEMDKLKAAADLKARQNAATAAHMGGPPTTGRK